MSLAIIHSRALAGIKAPEVIVEVHLSNGLPTFSIVGLPETAVKESRDRVRSALLNSQFEFPAQRITVNLAPADLPKEGGRYDLPIALGILIASDQLPKECVSDYEIAGELALSGELRSIRGALPMALASRAANKKLLLPRANADEAALLDQLTIYPAEHLLQVCQHLRQQTLIPAHQTTPFLSTHPMADLSDVKGQYTAKRALEIAAAGSHSLLMIGPPGTGKTMLASRLPSILPSLSKEEALEIATITSIGTGQFKLATWQCRPFRSPHHSASTVALVGGGNPPHPGEISLAHHGVLFLDELPEFDRRVLEALREPLESGTITISRAAHQAEFPARFQLIGAMNPCPCGHLGNPKRACRCTPKQIQHYRAKLSGPFLDRIDMHIEVPHLPPETLTQSIEHSHSETSKIVQARVQEARARQHARQAKTNAALTSKELESIAKLNIAEKTFIEKVMQKFNLSARVFHRVLRLARTIADLAAVENIHGEHLTEAVSYRKLERI